MPGWSGRPRFSTASVGYAPRVVDLMLDRLRDAAAAGGSVAPILESTQLTKVSFGYDMEEVDEYIAALILESDPAVDPAASTSTPSASRATPEPRARVASEPERSTPPAPVEARAESDRPDLVAAQLDAVRRVRFPQAARGQRGYEVGQVDDFLDRVEAALNQGDDVSAMVQQASFYMSRGGYHPSDVDRFLDWIISGETTLVEEDTEPSSFNVGLAVVLAIGIPLAILLFVLF